MISYGEYTRRATLQEIANGLFEDKEVEYVKLKNIDESLQLASIDGVKIANQAPNDNTVNLTEEELNEKINSAVQAVLVTEDIHLNSEYVSPRQTVRMTKSGNTIVLTAYLNVLKDITASATSTVTIITLDEPYRPKASFVELGHFVALPRYINVRPNGTIYFTSSINATTYPTLTLNLTWQI